MSDQCWICMKPNKGVITRWGTDAILCQEHQNQWQEFDLKYCTNSRLTSIPFYDWAKAEMLKYFYKTKIDILERKNHARTNGGSLTGPR